MHLRLTEIMRLPKILLIIACFILGAILAIVFAGSEAQQMGGSAPPLVRVADPSWTPGQVVQMQLNGLRDALQQPDGVGRCYEFASPNNRQAIGSLEQFVTLLKTPAYSVLPGHQGHIIGDSVVSEDTATVLVTVVDSAQVAHAFRFWLSKQATPPFESCWMTEAVLPIGQPIRTESPTGESPHE